MPYNTRRKSLSLPSLGIHVPISNAARAAAKITASTASTPTSSTSSSSSSKSMAPPPREDRSSKRLKRSHSDSEGSDAELGSLPPSKKRDSSLKFENTPPPSPPRNARASVEMADDEAEESKTIDLESINDEIVEAVIVQLQKTGNRPHLVKELAAVLMQQLKIVQQSANPCAIISSRLATYLKRNCWNPSSNPCPLGKELETVHPRRTYFYLTTCPHQPLPDPSHAAALSQLAAVQAVARAIISPAMSTTDTTSVSEDVDPESRRRQLSPSPEVDLSSPEFDDVDDDAAMPDTPIGSFTMRGGYNYFTNGPGAKPANGSARHHHNRATSPPLEKDEKEFTQTADGLQKRKLRGELLSSGTAEQSNAQAEPDFGSRDDSGLFGGDKTPFMSAATLNIPTTAVKESFALTSPAMRPSVLPISFNRKDTDVDAWAKLDVLDWNRSPETIELEELDFLLNDY